MGTQELLFRALPDEKTLETLLDRYTTLLFESLGEAEKRTETVTVEGVEQKLMVLRVELTQQDVVSIAEKLLKQAREDEDLLKIADKLAASAGAMGEFVDLRGELQMVIDEALAEIEMAKGEATDEVVLVLDTYVDDNHQIVGRSIVIPEAEEQLRYLTATKGSNFAFEVVAPGVMAKGSGTISGDGAKGSYTVFIEDKKVMTIELENIELKDGVLTGTAALRLESEFLAEAGLDSSMASLLGGNLSIRVSLQEKGADLAILAGANEVLGMAVTEKDGALSSFSVPAGISVDDEAALMEWVKGLDLAELIGNLQDAGVPAELVEIVNTLAQMLAYM
jgi:hypothetical protein